MAFFVKCAVPLLNLQFPGNVVSWEIFHALTTCNFQIRNYKRSSVCVTKSDKEVMHIEDVDEGKFDIKSHVITM